jgi:GGDEF domain-containing protein
MDPPRQALRRSPKLLIMNHSKIQSRNQDLTPVIRACDRRFDLGRRRRVAEMSLEEMRLELLTSEVTGLPNRRAFEEAGTSPAIALSDLDGLKALNNYGYAVGDAILKAKADALLTAGLDAYHDKGDEFLCRAVDPDELPARLEGARTILRNRSIQVQLANGTTLRVCGADFSYGVGTTVEDAETRLRSQKMQREARGELARGELCQILVAAEELHSEVIHADCPSHTVTSVTV